MSNTAQQTWKTHEGVVSSAFLLWDAYADSVQMSLSLVRANVRKHTQADNVKPPYIMQKVNTTTLKVTFASTSMAK